jgi:mRNA export factor
MALNPQNPNNDVVVPNSATDTISSLLWSSTGTFLASSGWSRTSTIFDIGVNGTAEVKATQQLKAPILCSGWSGDNSRLFLGTCEGRAEMWNLQSNQLQTCAVHSGPIKEIAYINELNLLLTASWDKTLKYWDLRQQTGQPALSVQLPERVYAMDMKFPVLVVCTAEKTQKNIQIYDISNPNNLTRPYRISENLLKHQSRCCSIFPDKSGFAVGSIEGRVAILHVQEKDVGKNFAFKCHRENSDVYSVNALAFHSLGTFATCGGDGRYITWDKDAKTRLKQFERNPNPITAASFNAAGNIFAYAIGYDWSKGVEYAAKQKSPCGILLHSVQEAEVKRKETGKTSSWK